MGYYEYYEYVSVAEKKEKAKKAIEKLKKKNPDILPVTIEGKKIANKWWGIAWNKNLEKYADLKNRIARGRSYVKNGFILDMQIEKSNVTALVQGTGSKPYKVQITIDKLPDDKWNKILKFCNHRIDTLETLIEGKFPKEFQEIFNESQYGMFPSPKEIHFKCSCPDSAVVCKHVAAVLYGIGARMDIDPLVFFKLRDIDFQELIKKSMEEKMQSMLKNADKKSKRIIDDEDAMDLFGL